MFYFSVQNRFKYTNWHLGHRMCGLIFGFKTNKWKYSKRKWTISKIDCFHGLRRRSVFGWMNEFLSIESNFWRKRFPSVDLKPFEKLILIITCDYTVDTQNILNDIHYFSPASPFQMQVSLWYRQHSSQWCRIIYNSSETTTTTTTQHKNDKKNNNNKEIIWNWIFLTQKLNSSHHKNWPKIIPFT